MPNITVWRADRAMRVTIDIQPVLHQRAGIGRYIEGLVDGLSRIDEDNRYNLTYFNFRRRGDPQLAMDGPNIQLMPLRWIPGRVAGRLWRYLSWPTYDWYFGDADIYHFTNFLVRPVREGKRIATIHDLSFLRFPQFAEPKNLSFLSRRIENTVRNADGIIADSEFSRNEILHWFSPPAEKVWAVHLGIDQRFFKPWSADDLKQLRKSYSLPERFVLYLGTLEPRKNLIGLLDAFEQYRRKTGNKDVALVLAGAMGWLSEDLEARIQRFDGCNCLCQIGYVSEDHIPGLYRLAKAFLFPSFYEGFGLPPLEAMAGGTPVMASDAGSLKEVLGDAALIIDPHDTDSMAEGLERIIEDDVLRRQLKARGLRQVQKFDWIKTARETVDVYRKTMNLEGGRPC